MSDFAEHCRKIVQRFLLTAIVVDDELNLSKSPPPHGKLKTPNSSTATSKEESGNQQQLRSLNVDQITASFSREGMVCGVVSPQEGHDDVLAKTVSRADIIILDWRLSRKTGETALPLLKQILSEGPQYQLRLIAIYTGEKDPGKIREEIMSNIDGFETNDRDAFEGHSSYMIDFGACRIVLYLKDGTHTASANSDRVVSEKDLPSRLIGDFTSKVEGLLPSVVLTALTAVRENVYRVVERFGSSLDPAFLAHRACLPQPQESEQHIVEQIASELHGIMDDAIITDSSPAGIEAIEYWFVEKFVNDTVNFSPTDEYPVEKVLDMLKRGLENRNDRLLNPKKFDILSSGFSKGAENSEDLDHQLASVMNFRQVLDKKRRQLTMGTIIRRTESESEEFLICVTPKCDSVRLTEQTSFLFLSLSNPKQGTVQIVVPVEENNFRRMSIFMEPSDWRIMDFEPDSGQQCVLACSDNFDHIFLFQDAKEQKYQWLGELKPEFAQSIAQIIAGKMSRVPLNQSEWLRRSERKG